MSTYQVPLPSLRTMAPQVFFFFFFEDLFHWAAHRALHTPLLYKHIHKIHHKYSAPFGLAAEYAHPAEVLILGTGTLMGPLLYCALTRNFHIVTMYVWITLRLFQAIDAHSGYGKFPTTSPLPSLTIKVLRLPMVASTHRTVLVRRRAP